MHRPAPSRTAHHSARVQIDPDAEQLGSFAASLFNSADDRLFQFSFKHSQRLQPLRRVPLTGVRPLPLLQIGLYGSGHLLNWNRKAGVLVPDKSALNFLRFSWIFPPFQYESRVPKPGTVQTEAGLFPRLFGWKRGKTKPGPSRTCRWRRWLRWNRRARCLTVLREARPSSALVFFRKPSTTCRDCYSPNVDVHGRPDQPKSIDAAHATPRECVPLPVLPLYCGNGSSACHRLAWSEAPALPRITH